MPQILTDPETWSSLIMRNAANSYGSRNMVFTDYAQCRKFFTDPETRSSLIMRNAANSYGFRNMVFSAYAQCRKFLRIQKHGLPWLCAMPQILTDPETWSWDRLRRVQWAPWCRHQHTSPAPAHTTVRQHLVQFCGQCCGSGMFIPGPRSGSFSILDHGSKEERTKKLVVLLF